MTTILVVDDDLKIARVVSRGLRFEGFAVHTAVNGPEALRIARDDPPDLVILDVMLPDIDGLEVCRRLRRGTNTPILMLTARDSVPDRVAGLNSGADDYLVKPFDFDELLARVRALLRRTQPASGDLLVFADLRLNGATYEAFRGERRLDLTAREFAVLHILMRSPRHVLTREQIMERVWGNYDVESNVVEVYIARLRDKLESNHEPRLIHTMRGIGYSLREEAL
ncbi:response regulator transcription factor [Candidatus Chloroploca mongolica]|nr:response regulator transcription factor [Candidatus Chloroploca mongolica]